MRDMSKTVLAVRWSRDLAKRFPDEEHLSCRVNYRTETCWGWHCPHCGRPTSDQGHHDCATTAETP